MRLVVGMTGATGAILGIRLLEQLREHPDVTTDLVMSKWARATIAMETDYSWRDVVDLADAVHGPEDQAASISSGSYRTDGMIVVPCSAKTRSGIRNGYGSGRVTRAADVTIKERRRLVLVAREAPLSPIHLENMLELSRMGVTVFPPMPAFYHRPATVDELVDHIVARVLDQFGLERWQGPSSLSA